MILVKNGGFPVKILEFCTLSGDVHVQIPAILWKNGHFLHKFWNFALTGGFHVQILTNLWKNGDFAQKYRVLHARRQFSRPNSGYFAEKWEFSI